MARTDYERLSALDAYFLGLEKPNNHMHVASTIVFDAGPLRKVNGGVDAEAIRQLVAAGLHNIPRYRQRLNYVPFDGRPVWVDDRNFNIDYHLRHTALPRPGSMAQLKRLSSRVMEQRLDRERPLWEMWIAEGLEENKFAIISKVHHCMIDGVSGVDLMKILMSPTPNQAVPDAPPFIPRPRPSKLELVVDEVGRRFDLAGNLYKAARSHFAGDHSAEQHAFAVRQRALTDFLQLVLKRPSRTPINRAISPHRRFDWCEMPLSELKEIRRRLDGSLNDVVLTLVTRAMRAFLERRRVRLNDLDFRTMVPVSVRSRDERGVLGNRVSAWIVRLPLHESNVRDQFRAIHTRTHEMKVSKGALGAQVLTDAAEWGSTTLLSLGARQASRVLPFNMVVTNVPGPQLPLYMLGAEMEGVFPMVPLTDNLGLGIALMSYNGMLYWGINADYDLVPDIDLFVNDIQDAFEALKRAE